MGLLVLGIPVAALSNIGGRDFFRGKTPVGWAGRFPFRCLECVH
jgi:hypothetical protein